MPAMTKIQYRRKFQTYWLDIDFSNKEWGPIFSTDIFASLQNTLMNGSEECTRECYMKQSDGKAPLDGLNSTHLIKM